jgi:RNA polymerase sigma factor (sigma-70 family)
MQVTPSRTRSATRTPGSAPGRAAVPAHASRAGVLNRCRSVHRRNAVRRKHAAGLAELPGSGLDAASAAADRDVLATALRGLPRRQCEVIVLRYYCDLDAGEVAAVLRIGPSAVRSTMSRGLAALALAMGEEDR